jgi:hypothetical protein
LGGEFGCGDVVVAEGLGGDRGGHFHDVLADGAGTAGGGGDAEVADQRGEGVGVHGLSGAAAGKQPAGVVVSGGVHVVAVVHPGEQEVGDWSGQRGWRVPEPQQDLVAVMDYVIDGEADDPAEGLGCSASAAARWPTKRARTVPGTLRNKHRGYATAPQSRYQSHAHSGRAATADQQTMPCNRHNTLICAAPILASSLTAAAHIGYLSGHAKTQLTLRDCLFVSLRPRLAEFALPTDYVSMAKVSCRARGHDPVRVM